LVQSLGIANLASGTHDAFLRSTSRRPAHKTA